MEVLALAAEGCQRQNLFTPGKGVGCGVCGGDEAAPTNRCSGRESVLYYHRGRVQGPV